MTFFLIVPSVIIIGIFLIHGIFNRLGLRIHYGALIICTVMTVAANAGAMMLSPAPDKFYFLRLGGFIFSASLIGTLANYFFVRREVKEQEEFSEEVKNAYEKSEEKIPIEEVDEKEEIEPVEPEKVSEPVKKIAPIKKVDLVKKFPPKKNITLKKKSDTDKISQDKKIVVAEKNVEPKKSPEQKEIPKISPENKKVVEVKKFEPKKIISEPKKISDTEEIHAEVNFSKFDETLDSMLDAAYSARQQGENWKAVVIYKKILEIYRGDNYAPFVAIDLGNLYKEQAMYAKAIKVFEDALELPAVKRSFSTTEKFQKNITYLKAVQSVLLRHKALTTPFSKISKIYLQEIESEFQTAQLKINS